MRSWRSRFHAEWRAREGRFTIHKTTRRIELSSLALRQLPVPFATGRAARICIIPFASTILIGGLFQSLSLRIFAFALLYPLPPSASACHPRCSVPFPPPWYPLPSYLFLAASPSAFPKLWSQTLSLFFLVTRLVLSFVSSLLSTPVTSFRHSLYRVTISIARYKTYHNRSTLASFICADFYSIW